MKDIHEILIYLKDWLRFLFNQSTKLGFA